MAWKQGALQSLLIVGLTACGGGMGAGAGTPIAMADANPDADANASSTSSGVAASGSIPSPKPMAASSMPPGALGGAPPVPSAEQAQGMLAMDECGLDTQWRGDEYCIEAPPADQGFQVSSHRKTKALG